jgi:hypothetical protein
LHKLPSRTKREVTLLIRDGGGDVVFAVGDVTTHIVASDLDALPRTRRAAALPAVLPSYVTSSARAGELLPVPIRADPTAKGGVASGRLGGRASGDDADSAAGAIALLTPGELSIEPYTPDNSFEVSRFFVFSAVAASRYACIELQVHYSSKCRNDWICVDHRLLLSHCDTVTTAHPYAHPVHPTAVHNVVLLREPPNVTPPCVLMSTITFFARPSCDMCALASFVLNHVSPGILFTLSLARLCCQCDPQACAAPDTDVPCRVVIHEGPVNLEQGSAEPSSAHNGPADSPRTLQDWIQALGVERRLVYCSVQMAKYNHWS